MGSEHFEISSLTLDNGGGQGGSTNFKMRNTFGQPTGGGVSQSEHFGVYIGYQSKTMPEYPAWVPRIRLAVVEVDFGQVRVNTTSEIELTVYNSGFDVLKVSEIVPGDPVFSCTPETMSIEAFGSAIVTVTFSPTTDDSFDVVLTFTCNDPDTPVLEIPLSGSGYYQMASLACGGGTAMPGQTDVAIDITVSTGDYHMAACRFDVLFDTDALSVADVVKGGIIDEWDTFEWSLMDGGIELSAVCSDCYADACAEGIFATVYFDVADTAAEGDYDITISEVEAADELGESVPAEVSACQLNVSEYSIGDVNGDQNINVLDVMALINHILGTVLLEADEQIRADCNPDEVINILDALNIVNVILGIIPECPQDRACKPVVTTETLKFLKALKPHFPAKEFERIMAMVKEVQVPEAFSLGQNYPNPFNPTTTISFALPGGEWRPETGDRTQPTHTTLKISNILGQEVRTLVDEVKEPGCYTVTWDGWDSFGQIVPSGIYFYQLSVNNGHWLETRRMVLMK